eukprot:67860_1
MGSKQAVPEQQISLTQYYGIIAGLVGSIMSILVILTIIILIKFKNKYKTNQTIYTFTYLTLFILLITPISYAFLRSSYHSKTMSIERCYIGYILFYPSYFVGQWMLSSLFLYRLYIIQYKSQNTQNIRYKIHHIAPIIFAILIFPLVIMMLLADKNFVKLKAPNTQYIFCLNDIIADDFQEIYPLSAAYILQSIYNIYLLISFICSFRKLNIENYNRIKKVKCKMLGLVTISVCITWAFMIIGCIIDISNLSITYSIMIDAICSYLLFFVKHKSSETQTDKSDSNQTTETNGKQIDTTHSDDNGFAFEHINNSKQHEEIIGMKTCTNTYVENVASITRTNYINKHKYIKGYSYSKYIVQDEPNALHSYCDSSTFEM